MDGARFEAIWQDVRFGLRTLRRSPGFAAIAVITLALGVGANAAIFSVVKAVLLDPLPYREAARLVKIAEAGGAGLDYTAVQELRGRGRSFESLSAFQDGPGILYEGDKAEMLRGLSVDANFFDTLGVRMQLGRTFQPAEQQVGRRLAIVLSHELWMRRFGGDSKILGRVLRLSWAQVVVVGVLPPEFQPLLKATSEIDPEMYYPLAGDPLAKCHTCQPVHLVSRLRDGVSGGAARAELGGGFSVSPLPELLLGRAGMALWVVWCAAGMVLLIACVNVANLLLSRATGRAREVALRTALGAGRGRVIRQFLTESLVLAVAGGALGTAMAFGGARLLASAAPAAIPRAQAAAVDVGVLWFSLAATVAAGILFGLAPAWRASRTDLTAAIRGADASGRTHNGLRNTLVVAEIALAFVLATGAGLMGRTFAHLVEQGAGFDPRNVLTLTTTAIGRRYEGNRIGYYRDALERVLTVPGVRDAALTSMMPMDYTDAGPLHREDRPVAAGATAPPADAFSVSRNYFRVMRIPLKRGRAFGAQDTPSSPRVAVIGESCARGLFAGEDPLGKRVKFGERESRDPWMTIVGVVGDVRQDGLDRPADKQVYMALEQEATIGYYRLVAKTAGDPMQAERGVRAAFAAVDVGSPVYHVKPLEGYYAGRLAERTFALTMLALFGGLALVLAAVGIYGVISYSVGLRTREFGVRMALGAERRGLVTLVLRQAAPVIGVGLAIGLVASMAAARLLGGLLFGVRPEDPATAAGAAVLLAMVGLAAAVGPARRAARVNPTVALRSE